MANKKPYDMNDRQMRSREKEMYGMTGVSLDRAVKEMTEAREAYVPEEYWDTVTFGHEKVADQYSDAYYSHFLIYWKSPETDVEMAERISNEQKLKNMREENDRANYERLRKQFEGK